MIIIYGEPQDYFAVKYEYLRETTIFLPFYRIYLDFYQSQFAEIVVNTITLQSFKLID